MAPWALAQQRMIAFFGAREPVPVKGNQHAIGDAIRNLIENAIVHSPPQTEISVNVQPDGRVSIVDHGPGISPEDRDVIFDRFWRGKGAASNGSGLGLAIVREIMNAHQGNIIVDAGPNGGAVFTLCFAPDGGGANGPMRRRDHSGTKELEAGRLRSIMGRNSVIGAAGAIVSILALAAPSVQPAAQQTDRVQLDTGRPASARPWSSLSPLAGARRGKVQHPGDSRLAAGAEEPSQIKGPITGDPAIGQKLVADRTRGGCLACHVMGAGGADLPGNVGPDLRRSPTPTTTTNGCSTSSTTRASTWRTR